MEITKQDKFSKMLSWCKLIFDYLKNKNPKEYDYYDDWYQSILMAYHVRNYKGLKMAYHDINEGSKALPQEDVKELNFYLREKFGEDLNTVDKRNAKKIERIQQQGKIRSDSEFYLVNEWIDKLLWDGNDNTAAIEALNAALLDYEERAAEKIRRQQERARKKADKENKRADKENKTE